MPRHGTRMQGKVSQGARGCARGILQVREVAQDVRRYVRNMGWMNRDVRDCTRGTTAEVGESVQNNTMQVWEGV